MNFSIVYYSLDVFIIMYYKRVQKGVKMVHNFCICFLSCTNRALWEFSELNYTCVRTCNLLILQLF